LHEQHRWQPSEQWVYFPAVGVVFPHKGVATRARLAVPWQGCIGPVWRISRGHLPGDINARGIHRYLDADILGDLPAPQLVAARIKTRVADKTQINLD
jgi:hypothetical protein